MKTAINNFCDASPLEISPYTHPECGPLVSIIQAFGSLSFQHSMRPEQARDMAEALLAAVEALEPTLLEVAA